MSSSITDVTGSSHTAHGVGHLFWLQPSDGFTVVAGAIGAGMHECEHAWVLQGYLDSAQRGDFRKGKYFRTMHRGARVYLWVRGPQPDPRCTPDDTHRIRTYIPRIQLFSSSARRAVYGRYDGRTAAESVSTPVSTPDLVSKHLLLKAFWCISVKPGALTRWRWSGRCSRNPGDRSADGPLSAWLGRDVPGGRAVCAAK